MISPALVKQGWQTAFAVAGVRLTINRPAAGGNPAKSDTNVRAKYGLAGAVTDLAGGLKVTQHELIVYLDDLKNLGGLMVGDRVVFEGRQGTVARADNTSGRIFGVQIIARAMVDV